MNKDNRNEGGGGEAPIRVAVTATEEQARYVRELPSYGGGNTDYVVGAASPSHLPAREAVEDLRTHRESWREALVKARDTADQRLPDTDDKGYWQHELDAFDRTFAALQLLSQGNGEAVARQCKARGANTGANESQDCDWPVCGCDPSADKVIETLEESGRLAPPSQPEEVREALEKARTWSDKTGVGCPLCKHEGDQWAEPCGLHAQIHELSQDLMLERRVASDANAMLDKIHALLSVDPEDDLLAHIEDLKAAAEDIYIVAGTNTTTPSRGRVEAAEWHEEQMRTLSARATSFNRDGRHDDAADCRDAAKVHEQSAKHFRTLSAKPTANCG